MSSAEGDITISIGIELTPKSTKAISTLNNLHGLLSNMAKMNISATKTFKELSGGVINIGDQLLSANTILKSFAENMGESGIKIEDMTENAKKVRGAISAYNASLAAGRMIIDMFGRSLTQVAWDPTEDGIKNISTELEKFRVEGKLGVDIVNQMSRAFGRAGVRVPTAQIKEMDVALGGNNEALIKWAVTAQESTDIVTQRLTQVAQMNRVVTASFGPMGVALMDAANSFFWFGLGSMFAVMSLMRLNRAILTIKSSNLSLVRANMRLVEAQQELNRYQEAGIVTGKAYANVVIGLRQATLAQELAEDRLKQSIQNRIYATMQLAFGTLPTLIRAGTSMFAISLKLAVASHMNTGAKWQEIIATEILTTAELGHAGVIDLVNKKLATYIMYTAMATGGLVILTAAIGAFIAKGAMDKQLAAANTEFEEMRRLMTETHSPPLYDTFKVMGENVEFLTRKMKGLKEATNVAGGLRGMSNRQGPVSIMISGPFYIKDSSDIDRIGDALMRRMKNRGAY